MDSREDTTPRVAADSFELDDDIILFAPHSGDLTLLNPTAALIWDGLADGLAIDEIVDALSEVMNRARDDVMRDCVALVEEWRRSGFVASGISAPDTTLDQRESDAWWGDLPVAGQRPRFEPTITTAHQLMDFRFRLRTAESPAGERAHEFLAHLRTSADGSFPSTLDLLNENGHWQLLHNGQLIDNCTEDVGVIPMLHGNLMVAAYKGSDCLAALHAAAVTRNGQGMLLAGIPGSGKSTLTAALLANGFGYLADDIVLLTGAPVRIRGVPMRLGLKEGSWPVLESLWPELGELPIYRRADQKRIRYLLPRDCPSSGQTRQPETAKCLVFPRYEAGAPTSFQRIRRARALLRIAESGYDIPNAISHDVVATLIEWLSGLECYELTYSEIPEAVSHLTTALS